MKFSRKTFFDGYRKAFGPLDQSEVDGLEFLLGKMEADPRWKNTEEIAYALSTIDHETNHTFQPIVEKRASRTRQPKLWASQNRYWSTGHQGRGFIQLTWPQNYERYGIKDEPDRALEPELAYEILTDGMHKGVYTGKKLSDYINDQETNYLEARRIVNAMDKAEQIAANAIKFEAILDRAAIEISEEEVKSEGLSPKPESEPVPQINIEHAEEVKTVPQPIEGGRKDDKPIQASQGGRKSTIATIIAGLGAAWTAIQGWFQNSSALKITGILCLTIVILAWMFRQLIMDYVRMNYMSDPTRLNVK